MHHFFDVKIPLCVEKRSMHCLMCHKLMTCFCWVLALRGRTLSDTCGQSVKKKQNRAEHFNLDCWSVYTLRAAPVLFSGCRWSSLNEVRSFFYSFIQLWTLHCLYKLIVRFIFFSITKHSLRLIWDHDSLKGRLIKSLLYRKQCVTLYSEILILWIHQQPMT